MLKLNQYYLHKWSVFSHKYPLKSKSKEKTWDCWSVLQKSWKATELLKEHEKASQSSIYQLMAGPLTGFFVQGMGFSVLTLQNFRKCPKCVGLSHSSWLTVLEVVIDSSFLLTRNDMSHQEDCILHHYAGLLYLTCSLIFLEVGKVSI